MSQMKNRKKQSQREKQSMREKQMDGGVQKKRDRGYGAQGTFQRTNV